MVHISTEFSRISQNFLCKLLPLLINTSFVYLAIADHGSHSHRSRKHKKSKKTKKRHTDRSVIAIHCTVISGCIVTDVLLITRAQTFLQFRGRYAHSEIDSFL